MILFSVAKSNTSAFLIILNKTLWSRGGFQPTLFLEPSRKYLMIHPGRIHVNWKGKDIFHFDIMDTVFGKVDENVKAVSEPILVKTSLGELKIAEARKYIGRKRLKVNASPETFWIILDAPEAIMTFIKKYNLNYVKCQYSNEVADKFASLMKTVEGIRNHY